MKKGGCPALPFVSVLVTAKGVQADGAVWGDGLRRAQQVLRSQEVHWEVKLLLGWPQNT